MDELWSEQAGTQPPPAQKPTLETTTITVKGVTLQSSGVAKSGRQWKLYKITDEHDHNYFTFHTSFQLGETYEVDWEWQEKGEKKWRAIPQTPRPVRQPSDEEPDDEIPF